MRPAVWTARNATMTDATSSGKPPEAIISTLSTQKHSRFTSETQARFTPTPTSQNVIRLIDICWWITLSSQSSRAVTSVAHWCEPATGDGKCADGRDTPWISLACRADRRRHLAHLARRRRSTGRRAVPYLAGEDSRRKISRQLNKGESMHARQFPRLAATKRPGSSAPDDVEELYGVQMDSRSGRRWHITTDIPDEPLGGCLIVEDHGVVRADAVGGGSTCPRRSPAGCSPAALPPLSAACPERPG